MVFRVHAEILRISEALPDLIQADAVLEVTGQAQAVVIRSIESVVKVPGVRKQIWHAWRHTCRQLQVCRDSAEVAQILAPGKP